MLYTDTNGLSDEQLVHKGLQLEREMMGSRFRLHTQQLEDTSSLKKLRRDVARVQTALRARENAQGLRKNALSDQYSTSFDASVGAAGGEESSNLLSGIVDKLQGSE